MFIKFRTPFLFAEDDGGGAGAVVAPDADPSLGAPSPDEQTIESPQDFRSARTALLREPPAIISTDEPVAPASTDAADEAAAIAELTQPPAAPPAAPTAPQGAAPSSFTIIDPNTHQPVTLSPEEALANWQVTQSLRTEAGVRAMIAQGAQALGYDLATIRAAFAQQTPGVAGAPESAPAAPAPDLLANISDDDLITGADLKGIVGTLVQNAVAQATAQAEAAAAAKVDPVRAAFEHQQQVNAQAAADTTYTELLGPVPEQPGAERDAWLRQAKAIQTAASAHLSPDNWNPADIRAALIRGHAEFTAEQESLFKAYLLQKKQDREGQPTSINGGHVTTSEPAKEPQNLAEARAVAKGEGFFK